MSILQRTARPIGTGSRRRSSAREICLVAARVAAEPGEGVALAGRRYQAVASEPVPHEQGRHYWHLAPAAGAAMAGS